MSKKAAKPQVKEQSYDIRDVVLAKVRGYPPWPGMVVDPETVPEFVQRERPNAKSKKGVWYCVRFFPAGDFAWLVPKDISKLQTHEIQAYINEPYKRSGDLLQGYRIALDPTEWEEQREALRAEAAEEEANAEIDQLESDGEHELEDEEEEKKPKTKKRKRESEVAPVKKTKAKAKKESVEPVTKKKPAAKGKKNGTKSKAMVESEDEGAGEAEEEDAGPSKKASPPPAKKAKRDKDGDEETDPAMANDPEAQKVRDWRHKLQKAFLNSKASPKDEDMPPLHELFTTVENYENMSIQYLSFSKIGKVMRHIYALSSDKVPRDEEFKFRERAKTLVDKWHDVLNANKPNGDSTPAAKPPTNGTSAEKSESPTSNGKKEDKPDSVSKADGNGMDVEDKPEGDDMNDSGATEGSADAPADADVPGESGAGDESVLADVTMSEVAA